MTKFDVYKERIEAARNGKDWTGADMVAYHENRSETYMDLIASFDTKEEAFKFFEEEKENCTSFYQDGYVGELVIFDIIEVWENEYDEDGDIIESDGVWKNYAAEI